MTKEISEYYKNRYHNDPEFRKKMIENSLKYQKSEKGKKRLKTYRKTDKHKEYNAEYWKKYRKTDKNIEYAEKYSKLYRLKNNEKIKELVKVKNREARISALNIVGKGVLKCSNCGCDKLDTLEINHINGNGYQEKKRGFYTMNNIINGKRKTDDLNILCKVCNIAYFIKQKYNIDYEIRIKT